MIPQNDKCVEAIPMEVEQMSLNAKQSAAQPDAHHSAHSQSRQAAAEKPSFEVYIKLVWDHQERWTRILKETHDIHITYARAKFDKSHIGRKYRSSQDRKYMADFRRTEQQLVECARRMEVIRADRVRLASDVAARRVYMDRLVACPDAKETVRLPRDFWCNADDWEQEIADQQEEEANAALTKALEEQFGTAEGLRYGEKVLAVRKVTMADKNEAAVPVGAANADIHNSNQ